VRLVDGVKEANITFTASFWTTAGELAGVILASYGLIRESFADLAEPRGFDEGRYGEGAFGGVPGPITHHFVLFAIWARLLPHDGKLTLTDRKRNAALAISGSVIAAMSLLVELILAVSG
jgi:hypothetical protein